MTVVETGPAKLRRLIEKSRSTVVFTGAGISTESGIPDFRSPGGLWTKFQPIEYQDFVASERWRRETWRRKIAVDETMQKAEPNRGHRAIAQLVQRGVVSAVITQNVDGLHQAGGVPDDKLIELHGNATYAKCLDCGHRHELSPIKEAFVRDDVLPECEACASPMVKPATISFGQPMPADAMQAAEAKTLACDLFIAIGSSLVVYPAAGFPMVAKRNGARLVILNRDPTDLDEMADLVLHAEIGPTLGSAVGTN